MLTQCPECNTTFRLHLRQLQAAAGKVRCSRCRATFNALDHLVETPTPAEPLPTEQLPEESIDATGEAPPRPHSEETDASTTTTAPGEADALDAFIDELRGEITHPHDTVQPATTALDTIDNIQEEAGADRQEITEDPFEETLTTAEGEPEGTMDDLFEEAVITAEEKPDDAIDDLFEEALTTAEGEPEGTIDDLFNEAITVAREEPDDAIDDLFEEALTTAEEEPEGTIDDLFEETVITAEEKPDDAIDDLFEETALHDVADVADVADAADVPDAPTPDALMEEPIVDEALFDAFLDEIETDIDTPYDPLLMEEVVDGVEEDEKGPDSFDALTQADMDAFFAEPATPDVSPVDRPQPDESWLDETPPDETSPESTEPPEPTEPAPSSTPMADTAEAAVATDPLAPFSEAQLESLLSPTATEAAGEKEDEVLDLDALQPPAELDLAGEEAPVAEGSTAPQAPPPIEEVDTSPPSIDYNLRTELTQTSSGSGAAPLLWGVGVALLCVVLALQYLYYHRLQLVENPQLRPLLTALCDLGDCELPPRRDLGRIELRDHLMQFHPNYEKSLLLSATLANRAAFAQPYPLVELVMTDIEQRVVARRRFLPAQYLPNHHEGDPFAPNSEVALLLEVLDPGNQAVGFEFRFY